MEKLLELLFSSLSGGQGKISLSSVKVSLLAAVGGLTESPAPATSLSRLARLATKHFITFLKEETHEATLVTCLQQLTKWTAKCDVLPEELVAWFPKGLTDKSSSSSVRCTSIYLHTTQYNLGCIF